MSEQKAPAKGQVKVRVLVDCVHGRVNDVVPLDEKVAAQAQKDGLVDAGEAAVAYAESLAKTEG